MPSSLTLLLAVQARIDRLEGIGDGARGLRVRRQAGQVDGFVDGVVAGEVRQRGGAELDHALRHQAQQLRTLQAHFIEALDVGRDLALGQLGNGLGPERLFVIVVGRQVRQAADDLQLRLGQVLGVGGAGAGRPPWRRIRGFSSWIKLLAAGMSAARGSPLAARGRECGTRIASAGPWLYAGPPEPRSGSAAAREAWLRRRPEPVRCPSRYPRAAFTGARYRCGGIAPSGTRSVQSYVAMPRYKYSLVWRATASITRKPSAGAALQPNGNIARWPRRAWAAPVHGKHLAAGPV